MLQFVRKTRLGERVEIKLPRAIQLAPEPKPRTLLQRRRTRGMDPSRKAGEMVGWSDVLERDYLLHLEFDPAVSTYTYRPAATIYRSPRFENLQLLDSCRGVAFPPEWRTEAALIIGAKSPCDMAQLTSALGGGQRIERQILAMIASGLIETDLDAPISGSSILSNSAEVRHV